MINLNRPLSSRTVADATVYPTMRQPDRPNQLLMGVFDSKGTYLPDSGLDRRSGEIGAEVPRDLYDEQEPAVFPEAIYCGVLYFHFGHFLLESIARLWYAQQQPELPLVWAGARNWYKGADGGSANTDPRLPKDWTQHSELLGWQREMLDILGVTNPVAIVTRPASVGELHMPDIGYRYDDQFHPDHAAFLASYHGPEQDPESRLWLSRSGIGTAVRDLNAPAIERRLTRAGWDIRFPERQTLREQLDQMARASVIAGEEGSAFHLLMLLDDISTKRFEIVRRLGTEHRNMRTVGEACGVNQRFTTLKCERVLQARGRYVTKVSEGAAETLDLLDVPIETPPDPTASALLAASLFTALRKADSTIEHVLALGVADARPLAGTGAKRVTVVSEALEVDPRLPELRTASIFEMPAALYFSAFPDATPYDVIIIDSTDPEAALGAMHAGVGAGGPNVVWLLVGSSNDGLAGVWKAAARVMDSFPGIDARTVVTGDDQPAAALLWYSPRGEPMSLLGPSPDEVRAPSDEISSALHPTADIASAVAAVTATRRERPVQAVDPGPAAAEPKPKAEPAAARTAAAPQQRSLYRRLRSRLKG
ncbi:glycosyltransferase 61 family protein [Tessaracoccus sp. Y1736]